MKPINQHVNNIIKNATQNRGMLYPILNRTSPIPMKNRFDVLKLDVFLILIYAGPVHHLLSMAQNIIRPKYRHKNDYRHVYFRQDLDFLKISFLNF